VPKADRLRLLNVQDNQHNNTDPDHERRERYGIVFEPVPTLYRHHAPRKQQKPPRGGPIASVSVVQRDRNAVNRDGSTRLLPQYFKCVSWARFCASSYENTRAIERAALLPT
jgi:hypothetical protein